MKFSDIELPSNRKFGLFFSALFILASAYFISEGSGPSAWIFSALAIIVAFVALTRSELLLPFNKLWMRFGLLLGTIVSPIVLGVIFFLIFTPIGILMRLSGRDELRLKAIETDSFWKHCEPSGPSAESFKNQF